jgi:hypothetical protein
MSHADLVAIIIFPTLAGYAVARNTRGLSGQETGLAALVAGLACGVLYGLMKGWL